LSEASALLREIEERGIFSNFGPVNARLERDLVTRMFAGEGACMTVCNATIGLMLAVRQAIEKRPATGRRYALMPSFTFAAAAHAAMWCGLTPLFCDVDPDNWAASAAAEDALLRRFGDDIAVIMPYATFGYDIDLARYETLIASHDIPVVVDAAASLGTVSGDGRGFGTGFSGSLVFSMHATKSFATGEAGIIYSANKDMISELRQMCNFGFGQPRTATMPGLNGKLSEVGALLGQLRLTDYDSVMEHRAALVRRYRQALPELTFQPDRQSRQAHQFASALLPRKLAPERAAIAAALAADGIGSATYFSPHLLQQDYFRKHAESSPIPVTDDVASRIISLPLFDTMTQQDLAEVVAAMQRQFARLMRPKLSKPRRGKVSGIAALPAAATLPAAAAQDVSREATP
jgi:dTDP-4-amino-4,6-dideoxygalactose transaminase